MASMKRLIVLSCMTGTVAAWMSGSALHEYENADSLVLSLVSLLRWTPFYWEQDRYGMLIPLLAMPIRHPLGNLVFQGWLSTIAALLAPYLAVRYLAGDDADWIGAGSLSNALLVVFAPLAVQFDWLATQAYALSIALAFGALVVLERPGLVRSAIAAALLVLAHWVNTGVFLIAIPAVLVARRSTMRALLTVATGMAAGLVFSGLSSAPHTSSAAAAVSAWPHGWLQLLSNASSTIGHPVWLGLLIVAAVIVTATLADARSLHLALRAAGSAVIIAVGYALVVGSSRWVELNVYLPRYIYPSLFLLAVALSILLVSPFGGKRSSAPVIALLGAVVIVYGLPSSSRVRHHIDESFGRLTPEILATGTRVIAGDYWTVWPSVFHANLALYRQRGTIGVYGLTYRSVETDRLWCHAEDVLVAARSGDRAIGVFADRILLPLRFLEHKTMVDLFAAGPCGVSR
jgi:hypothetical protein